jgi:hypothetical protein
MKSDPAGWKSLHPTELKHHRDSQRDARIPAVIQIIPVVVIVHVEVVADVPVIWPVFRPWINQQERKAAVLEAGITIEYAGAAVEAERVLTPEI